MRADFSTYRLTGMMEAPNTEALHGWLDKNVVSALYDPFHHEECRGGIFTYIRTWAPISRSAIITDAHGFGQRLRWF